MKTFLCILAVASVANATLPNIFGGGSGGGSSRGGSRSSSSSTSGSSKESLGDSLGSALQGISSLLSGGGPSISTHHQLDHNVNVVHSYAPSQGVGVGGGYGDAQHQVVEVIEENGGGGYHHADHQDVHVIRVIHEEAAPAYHGYGHGSEGQVKIIKVLHQEAPGQIGW